MFWMHYTYNYNNYKGCLTVSALLKWTNTISIIILGDVRFCKTRYLDTWHLIINLISCMFWQCRASCLVGFRHATLGEVQENILLFDTPELNCNTDGKCPNVPLNTWHGFTLTDGEMNGRHAINIPSFFRRHQWVAETYNTNILFWWLGCYGFVQEVTVMLNSLENSPTPKLHLSLWGCLYTFLLLSAK